MDKNYSEWHFRKTDIQQKKRNISFHEREIWLCSIGLNVGDEEDGKGDMFIRPIVIIRKFNRKIFWAIPFISKIKEDLRYYFRYDFGEKYSVAILSQLRLIDEKRLVRKIDVMRKNNFIAMKQKINDIISDKKATPTVERESRRPRPFVNSV